MQWYKFKALVALDQPEGGSRVPLPVGRSRRMAVRGRHRQTRDIKFFSAMVTNNGPRSPRWKERHVLLTVVITGDDAPDYFGIGNSLAVWLGDDIGHGIVTRSLSPWPAHRDPRTSSGRRSRQSRSLPRDTCARATVARR